MKQKLAIAFFMAGTALMAAFWRDELLLLALMGGAAAAALALDGWREARQFAVAVAAGGACENIAVFMGAWRYSNADYLFTPLWLPIGWGMAAVLLDGAFGSAPARPSAKSALLALAGTICVGIAYRSEAATLLAFIAATALLFALGYHRREDVRAGVMAALLGTAMETACMLAGAWHYSAAMLGTPLWLPLCWFNAFLIMRRVMHAPGRCAAESP